IQHSVATTDVSVHIRLGLSLCPNVGRVNTSGRWPRSRAPNGVQPCPRRTAHGREVRLESPAMPKPLRVRAALAVLAVLASTAVIAIATAPVAEAATVVNLAPLVISSKGDFNSYCVTASTDGRTTSAEGCPDSIPVGM